MKGQSEWLSREARRWSLPLARFGLVAQGVVYIIIGSLAALTANPHQARGLRGALQAVEQQPFGPWRLGVVALGLMAYGLYMLLLARDRRTIL